METSWLPEVPVIITQSALPVCQRCLLQRSAEVSSQVTSCLRRDPEVTLRLSISSAPLKSLLRLRLFGIETVLLDSGPED